MSFDDFVKQQRSQQSAGELPHLKDTHELALVLVAGTLITADIASQLPPTMQDEAIEAIVDQVKVHIDRYIQHHYASTATGYEVN